MSLCKAPADLRPPHPPAAPRVSVSPLQAAFAWDELRCVHVSAHARLAESLYIELPRS